MRPVAFLTNSGAVLLCIADDPDVRLRDVAARVGITERAAHAIVDDLVTQGFISRTRVGRRNRYGINAAKALGQSPIAARTVADLLLLLGTPDTLH